MGDSLFTTKTFYVGAAAIIVAIGAYFNIVTLDTAQKIIDALLGAGLITLRHGMLTS